MSWESTVPYYATVNRTVAARLGGLHSAKLLLSSLDFHELEALQREDRWEEAGELLVREARALERGGADFLVICSNTMHRCLAAVESAVAIPVLHIADATARAIRAAGLTRVGLLGTRFTMEGEFYRARLEDRGIEVLTPPEDERALVHRVIYDELCLGRFLPASRGRYLAVMRSLVERGAGGIVLGCTEIGLLVGGQPFDVPLFDTAELHARAAAELAMEGTADGCGLF